MPLAIGSSAPSSSGTELNESHVPDHSTGNPRLSEDELTLQLKNMSASSKLAKALFGFAPSTMVMRTSNSGVTPPEPVLAPPSHFVLPSATDFDRTLATALNNPIVQDILARRHGDESPQALYQRLVPAMELGTPDIAGEVNNDAYERERAYRPANYLTSAAATFLANLPAFTARELILQYTKKVEPRAFATNLSLVTTNATEEAVKACLNVADADPHNQVGNMPLLRSIFTTANLAFVQEVLKRAGYRLPIRMVAAGFVAAIRDIIHRGMTQQKLQRDGETLPHRPKPTPEMRLIAGMIAALTRIFFHSLPRQLYKTPELAGKHMDRPLDRFLQGDAYRAFAAPDGNQAASFIADAMAKEEARLDNSADSEPHRLYSDQPF